MKLYELRKDEHTAFVTKDQIAFMVQDGWEPKANVKVKK
jgi:hypothetical protein